MGERCWPGKPGGRVQWKWPGCLANKLTDNGSWQCTCLPLDICRLPWKRMSLPPRHLAPTHPFSVCLCLFVLSQDDNDDNGGKGLLVERGKGATPPLAAADVTHSWSFCWVNRLKNLCCLQKQNLPSPSFDSRHWKQLQWWNMAKIMCTVLEYLKLALYKALLDIYTYIVEPFHIHNVVTYYYSTL